MNPKILSTLRALRGMNVPELRAKYRQAFREEPRSYNRDFLWKRLAWRLQAQAEGDLSERARRRAAELAQDADVRLRAPRGAYGEVAQADGRTEVRPYPGVPDNRLPMPGTVLTREYRGRTVRATVLDRGFEWEGKVYRSLTALASHVTGTRWNGFHFFRLSAAGAGR